MIPKQIFQKVRQIEITTSRLVTDVFAGQYHSVFKGRGIEFDEAREYLIGDDIRTIDWNVTARTGALHIKKYVEERELTVMILVDFSRSCQFASVNQLKSKLAAEIAAVLAFAAIRNNDKIGMVAFTDHVEKFIAPRKGVRHVLRVIREMLYFSPKGFATNITKALEYLNKLKIRRAVLFVVSDFFDRHEFKKALSIANKRHDVVAITLNDPREKDLPECGLLELEDAETGEFTTVDSSDKRVRYKYGQDARDRLRNREMLFASAGIDHIDVSTETSYTKELKKFFITRRSRRLS